jgi:hypothetical protein
MSNIAYVQINSDQTGKTIGRVAKVEWSQIWGPQYLIVVEDSQMGEEYFWMKASEIQHLHR